MLHRSSGYNRNTQRFVAPRKENGARSQIQVYTSHLLLLRASKIVAGQPLGM